MRPRSSLPSSAMAPARLRGQAQASSSSRIRPHMCWLSSIVLLLLGGPFSAVEARNKKQSMRGVAATSHPQVAVANVDFPYPYLSGHPIDTCLAVGASPGDCGKASADWWCRFQKCTEAVSYEESAGGRGPTWVPVDGVVRETGGNSFDLITCVCSVPVAPSPADEAANQIVYEEPKILNHPVDVCLFEGKKESCGKPAADAFCQSFGSKASVRFEQASGKAEEPTWMIGDHAINKGADRQAFKSIACV